MVGEGNGSKDAMTPITCSRCGAPLPAVAADQRHPDWCPTCAARATGDIGPAPVSESSTGHGMRPAASWGTPPPGPPPPLVLQSAGRRYLEGAFVGLAVAGLGMFAVWAALSVTGHSWPLVVDIAATVLGVLVGQAVLIGTRRGGPVPALVAALAVLVPLVIAQYFIERSSAISLYNANLPLWQGFTFARKVVTDSITDHPLRGLGWAVAIVAAALCAGSTRRRALL